MPNSPTLPLAAPVKVLSGVGPDRAAQLARLEVRTVEDLLLHRPRRYEDRRRVRPFADLRLNEAATTRGKIVAQGIKRWRGGTKSVFEIILEDGTGRLHCRWWNLPFMEKYFQVGNEVLVFGKPVSLKPRTMDHPETEVIEGGEEISIHLNRVAPIYPLTEGLPQRWLRALIWRTLEKYERHIVEPVFGVPALAGRATEKVTAPRAQPSAPQRDGTPNLPTRANAIHMLHFPEELPDAELGRRRLAFDEFLELQLAIQTRRKNLQANARGLPCAGDNRLIKPFLARLGFPLTAAQTRVLRELRRDLGGAQPMRRLLQGDVGSGKTVVAACCALMALEGGFNVALMAPTEILAEQHYRTFHAWLEPLGVMVELRTGSRKTSNAQASTLNLPGRAAADSALRTPLSAFLTIGTHALITEGFDLPKLGLVIIDEQHKFGVAQREKLVRKGRYPHLLVMTATPIPRTLGLTLYGDLDISVIDEMPAGRGRIQTFLRAADRLDRVWAFLKTKLTEGRQAYVVYPRVEEDEGGEVKAVKREWERLRAQLAPFQVGLLHGRMAGAEKDRVTRAFAANELHVLLATSIIEVGIDVPNATVMLIENAEQFGLAQLHQLRGRIGRGAHDSYCVLVAPVKTDEAKKRLQVLAATTDGFQIAEADLRLRGPGELLGRQQSGLPPLRFGDLAGDRELVEQARRIAGELLANSPVKKQEPT